MGADLIGVPLVIKEGTAPDWDAAEAWAENLTVESIIKPEMAEALLNYCGEEIDTEWVEKNRGTEDYYEWLAEVRSIIRSGITEAQEIYDGEWRNTMEFVAGDRRVFILAETTWGDSPEGFDSLYFFVESGAAQVAGFEIDA